LIYEPGQYRFDALQIGQLPAHHSQLAGSDFPGSRAPRPVVKLKQNGNLNQRETDPHSWDSTPYLGTESSLLHSE